MYTTHLSSLAHHYFQSMRSCFLVALQTIVEFEPGAVRTYGVKAIAEFSHFLNNSLNRFLDLMWDLSLDIYFGFTFGRPISWIKVGISHLFADVHGEVCEGGGLREGLGHFFVGVYEEVIYPWATTPWATQFTLLSLSS